MREVTISNKQISVMVVQRDLSCPTRRDFWAAWIVALLPGSFLENKPVDQHLMLQNPPGQRNILASKKLIKINLICLSIQSQLLSSLEKKITEEESPTWKSFKLVLLPFFLLLVPFSYNVAYIQKSIL